MEVEIRKARKSDLSEISQIYRIENGKKPYRMIWTPTNSMERIEELFSGGDIYLTLVDEKVVGFIALRKSLAPKGKTAHVEELWFLEKYQGNGLGKQLIKFVEKKYKNKIRALTLESNKDSKAFGFYKNLNFKPCDKETFMRKTL